MGHHYLAFTLGRDIFAFNARSVKEVFQAVPVSPLPNAPCYMNSPVNLRGSAIPVIDLRIRLGMEKTRRTPKTCIIVLEPPDAEGGAAVGVLVDEVVEVVEQDAAREEIAPDGVFGLELKYFGELGERSSRPVMVVDVFRLLSERDRELLIA